MAAFVLNLASSAVPSGPPPLLQAVRAQREEFCVECCGLYCAAPPELLVSRHLDSQRTVRYGAEGVADGKAETAWVVRGGEGEWLEFRFVDTKGGERSPGLGIDELFILNGYGKSDAHWRDHSRVRELALVVDGYAVARIRLLDDPAPQRVPLPRIPLHEGLSLRLVVKRLYPGSRFAETAVSEVRVDGYGHH